MISQTDIIIYEAIKLGLQDLRENLWLIDDIFSMLTNERFLFSRQGASEVEAIKNWFQNTDIPVLLKYRIDEETYPCITVSLGPSSERTDLKHLSDLSTDIETISPIQAKKYLPPIVSRFVPKEVNAAESYVVVGDDFSFRGVRAGQTLVDLQTGISTVITKIDNNKIYFNPVDGLTLNELSIMPEHVYFKVRREHAYFQETVEIGCHALNEPIQSIWLSSIVMYILLRFRESLLEGKYYSQSQVKMSEMVANEIADKNIVYSRYITMSGIVEYTWLKGLKRVIEKIELENYESEDDIRTGIQFLSNEDSLFSDDINDALWTTVKDEEQ